MIGPMRWPGFLLLLAVLLSGCIGFGGCRISFAPLAAGEREIQRATLENPGDGPPVECRLTAAVHCETGFTILDPRGDRFADRTVERIVVSCVGRCTDLGGETRIDAVFVDGGTELVASGGYGEFEQSCA